MKAIMKGTLAEGFFLSAIVQDAAEAERLVISLMANGRLAEAMEVEDPANLDKNVKADEGGKNFVVYGNSLAGGFTMYGPFEDGGFAAEFAEDHRGEDEEWEIFPLLEPVEVAA